MLVLSRSIGEDIIINKNIVVRVIGKKGGNVLLGISAPEGISINRKEIQDEIDKNSNPNKINDKVFHLREKIIDSVLEGLTYEESEGGYSEAYVSGNSESKIDEILNDLMMGF